MLHVINSEWTCSELNWTHSFQPLWSSWNFRFQQGPAKVLRVCWTFTLKRTRGGSLPVFCSLFSQTCKCLMHTCINFKQHIALRLSNRSRSSCLTVQRCDEMTWNLYFCPPPSSPAFTLSTSWRVHTCDTRAESHQHQFYLRRMKRDNKEGTGGDKWDEGDETKGKKAWKLQIQCKQEQRQWIKK